MNYKSVTGWTAPPSESVTINNGQTTSISRNYTQQTLGSLQFNSSTYTVAENGGSIRIYVSRTGGSSGSASVNYATANGTATAGSDYTANSGTLSWSAGDAADKYFDVSITNDSTLDNNEIFTANLSGASGASIGSPSQTTVTIVDDEKPTISIAATDASAAEPSDNGDFTIERIGITTGSLRVYYNTSGSTATSGSDYVALPGYVDIPSGQTSAHITVVVKDDNDEEGSEIVKVTLTSQSSYDIDPSLSSATVTIADDEGAAPEISGFIPERNSFQAAIDTIIQLHITDSAIGVDYESVTIHIESDLIYDGAEESSEGIYDSTGKEQTVKGICRREGTEADYTFVFQPSSSFDYEQKVDVAVSATDKADNDITETYYFYTVMRTFGKNVKVNSDTGTLEQNRPDTARDSKGNIWIVWDQATSAGDTDIYIAKLPAGGNAFESSVPVFIGANSQRNPAIAIDGSDKLYVVWEEYANPNWDILLLTSTDGIAWTYDSGSKPFQVNVNLDPTDTAPDPVTLNPDIAIDSLKKVYVTWEEQRNDNKDIWVRSLEGDVWGAATQITNEPSSQTEPSVGIDLIDNTAYIVWTDARNTETDIYGAKSTSWSINAIVLVYGETNLINPVCAISDGVLHVSWIAEEDGYDTYVVYGNDENGLPFTYRPHINDDLEEGKVNKSKRSPAIAVNGTKVFACWQDWRDVANNSDTDIYYAENTGSDFGTNILVNDDVGINIQTDPVIGIDNNGNPYMVWVDNREGNNDIYYAGAMSVGPALVTSEVSAVSGDTVEVNDRLKVEIPAGALVADTTVTIAEMVNPPELPSGTFGVFYEFSPGGLEFNTPVTVTLPHASNECPGYSIYSVYWYDSSVWPPASPWTQDGITNVQHIELSPTLHAVRFQTTHFTGFGTGGGFVPAPVGGGGGGGGGGGCAISTNSQGNAIEYMLPYIFYIVVLLIVKLKDAGNRNKKDDPLIN